MINASRASSLENAGKTRCGRVDPERCDIQLLPYLRVKVLLSACSPIYGGKNPLMHASRRDQSTNSQYPSMLPFFRKPFRQRRRQARRSGCNVATRSCSVPSEGIVGRLLANQFNCREPRLVKMAGAIPGVGACCAACVNSGAGQPREETLGRQFVDGAKDTCDDG